MSFLEKITDPKQLYTIAELFELLEENGAHDRTLSEVRNHYCECFGNEMMWRYPISDGKHAGTFIILTQEGLISLPYDSIDSEDYEIPLSEEAAMFQAEDMQKFISNWTRFSEDLLLMMQEAKRALSLGEDLDKTVRGYVQDACGSYGPYRLLENTPENISAFIAGNMAETRVTDVMDRLIISGIGGFVKQCPDREYLLHEIHPVIIPMQESGKVPEVIYAIESESSEDEDDSMF